MWSSSSRTCRTDFMFRVLATLVLRDGVGEAGFKQGFADFALAAGLPCCSAFRGDASAEAMGCLAERQWGSSGGYGAGPNARAVGAEARRNQLRPGPSYQHLLRRWQPLTRFLSVPGTPLVGAVPRQPAPLPFGQMPVIQQRFLRSHIGEPDDSLWNQVIVTQRPLGDADQSCQGRGMAACKRRRSCIC
jgi:hypothetical protein